MSMEETGNNPSGTDSLTEAEAVSKLSGLLAARESEAASATDENESVDDTQPQEVEEDATEEQAETHSDEEEASTDSEEEATAEDAANETAVVAEIDGKSLTLADLKSGYMQQADYTRKTTELKEERKHLESHKEQFLVGVRAELAQRADAMAAIASQFALPKPSVQMAQEDPVNYPAAMALWEQQQQAIQGLLHERDSQMRINTERQQALLQEEQAKGFEKLLELHTDLADATPILDRSGKPTYDQKGRAITKGTQEIASLWQYGVNIFGQELMQQVADPRMFDVLRKAQKQDRNDVTVSKVKQQVASKPALAKPGVSRGVADSSQQERAKAMARLNKSGSVEDAIAALKLASKRK